MSENQAATNAENQEGEDPSMEEILASIRKIITDDDQPDAETNSEETETTEEDVLELTEELSIDPPSEESQAVASPKIEDAPMEAPKEQKIEATVTEDTIADVAMTEPEIIEEVQSAAHIDEIVTTPETEVEKPVQSQPVESAETSPEDTASTAMADAMAQAEVAMEDKSSTQAREKSIKNELNDMEERLLSEASAAAASASLSDLSAQVMMGTGNQSLETIVKGVLRPLLKAWLDEHLPVIVEKLVRAEIDKITN